MKALDVQAFIDDFGTVLYQFAEAYGTARIADPDLRVESFWLEVDLDRDEEVFIRIWLTSGDKCTPMCFRFGLHGIEPPATDEVKERIFQPFQMIANRASEIVNRALLKVQYPGGTP